MTTSYVEEILRGLDPCAQNDLQVSNVDQDAVWHNVVAAIIATSPKRPLSTRRSRRFVGASSLVAAIIAGATLFAGLAGVSTSAVAATLQTAANADAHAAELPQLSSGQYYYQESQISLACQFSGTNAPANEPSLNYVANGMMQSWTTADGSGKVVITPSVVGGAGSHFATAADEARWVAMGKPFIPCALGNASNQLIGNPANADTSGSLGGYAATVSGYGGFGITLAAGPETKLVSSSTAINNLPQNAQAIATLLANGQINVDGSLNSSPGVCPVLEGSRTETAGCTADEQLAILEQLLQLPDASAKLGSTLYDVISNLPGATLAGTVALSGGASGTIVNVPSSDGSQSFQVVLNSQTGALVSCSELVTVNGATSPVGTINYGLLQVVQGMNSVPKAANNP